MTITIIGTIGTSKVHAPAYTEADWHERDNFETEAQARNYGEWKSRQYPTTPYRIVARDDLECYMGELRFALEFVPEWKLKG